MSNMRSVVDFIKSRFPNQEFIALHEPKFIGNEREYVIDAIDSTFVSSVGNYVNRFEEMMAKTTGTKYAVATVNGTAALHMSLVISGVKQGDEVLSQALTFVATANSISYIGADPVFIDVDKESMGMCPMALKDFLDDNAILDNGVPYNRQTKRRIGACVPMHTFGHPCKIDEIVEVCSEWSIPVVEDAAESIGSYFKSRHTGSFGLVGAFSFNGNKTLTCGGGGAIVTDSKELAELAKHLTTQAKVPHKWEFAHDMIGYNYRMPNLNAAVACAQIEQLDFFVENKRKLAKEYDAFFKDTELNFKREPIDSKSNYWLNVIEMNSVEERDDFLNFTNNEGIMTRPVWNLMSDLPVFRSCQNDGLATSRYLSDRLVNIPSSARPEKT
ncbi:MAG: LegC family aminotransferase [Cyclobacteriaceae bacterium]